MEIVIDHVEQKKPEDWNEVARQELMAFLMLRAGFQFNNGGEASEWEAE